MSRTGADLVACDYVEAHPNADIPRRPRRFGDWTLHKSAAHLLWWAAPSAVIARRDVVLNVGGFDSGQRYAEDNDLWRRISWKHSIHQMDEILVRCRRGHESLMTHERRRFFYDLRLFAKMQFDTPREFRADLPPFWSFVPPRLIAILCPGWVLTMLHRIQPRRRMLDAWLWLRRGPHPWLRPRTRILRLREWAASARREG